MKEKSSDECTSPGEEFYRLIPKGRVVEEQPEQPVPQNVDMSESKKRQTINEFRKWNNKLQNAFGYRNPHQSELEEAFNIKPLFILDHGFPAQQAGAALLLLVADQDVFFKDADDIYRTKYVNRRFLSDRKRTARELKQAHDGEDSIQNWLIERSLQKTFHLRGDAAMESDSRDDVGLARNILFAVIHEAKSHNRNVYQWLYSQKHISLSENNRAYYEWKYETFPDGYVDTTRAFPEKRGEQKDFIKSLLERDNSFQTGMLDIEVCKQDFQRLVPECVENPLCSMEFYDKVILCLAEYISHERQIKYIFRRIRITITARITLIPNGFSETTAVFKNAINKYAL